MSTENIAKVLQSVKKSDIDDVISSILNSTKSPLDGSKKIIEASLTQHEIRLLNPIQAKIKLNPQNEPIDPE